jgi:hypothetical protein
MRSEKIWNQLLIAESTFFIVIFHFLLVEATVNARARVIAQTVVRALAMVHWC